MTHGGQPFLSRRAVTCPCCGERVETMLDSPRPGLRYTEDCPVCCQPIEFHVTMTEDGECEVSARPEND